MRTGLIWLHGLAGLVIVGLRVQSANSAKTGQGKIHRYWLEAVSGLSPESQNKL